MTRHFPGRKKACAGEFNVLGNFVAENRGADFVKYLVPSLRARTRLLTGHREHHKQAELSGLSETLLNQPAGIIRIGLNRNAEFLRISPLYQLLRTNYPNLKIILHQSISGTILKLTKNNELDCGFILGSCDTDELNLLPLARFKLRVVGPIALQAGLEMADLAALAELPWIGIPQDYPYSRILEQYFHARGLYPRTEVVADQQSAITSMVASGVGLNFMLEQEAIRAEEVGQVALWSGGSFPIKLSFAYRVQDHHSSRLQAVKKAIVAIWSKV